MPLSQSGTPPADLVIDPMDADDVDVDHMEVDPDFHHLQPRRSTRVSAHAPHLEQVRWRSQSPAIDSSDSDTASEDSSSSDESQGSDLNSHSSSEFPEDDGYLSAWELLGEDFKREAHSLGTIFDNESQCDVFTQHYEFLAAQQLSEEDLNTVCGFALKVRDFRWNIREAPPRISISFSSICPSGSASLGTIGWFQNYSIRLLSKQLYVLFGTSRCSRSLSLLQRASPR